MASETVSQTWQRITGKPWSEAKKMGLTDGSASANLALQKKLAGGFNPYAPAAAPQAAAPAAAADPMEAYRKMVTDWYTQKPSTPATFNYSSDQEAADKRSVGEQYRPFYQEQASQAGDSFNQALQSAREGFSRRGLWGASAGTQQTTDPNTGITTTNVGGNAPTGGPVSGIRQRGEAMMSDQQGRTNTAFGRAYTEAVAGGVQNRRAEAQDVYDKTINQPYQEQYKNWLTRLQSLQSQAGG